MTKLPADFVESAVAILDREWVLAGPLTTSEGGRAMLQRDLTRQLHAGETATVPLAHIIMMADAGHESAQLALRTWIATHIDESRFNELPLQAQNYALKV
jgi:hypothetical protein